MKTYLFSKRLLLFFGRSNHNYDIFPTNFWQNQKLFDIRIRWEIHLKTNFIFLRRILWRKLCWCMNTWIIQHSHHCWVDLVSAKRCWEVRLAKCRMRRWFYFLWRLSLSNLVGILTKFCQWLFKEKTNLTENLCSLENKKTVHLLERKGSFLTKKKMLLKSVWNSAENPS